MAPVLPGMKAGWPRGTAPISNDSKEVKNPSLTLNRQVNLYPLTNYTFGTKGITYPTYLIIIFQTYFFCNSICFIKSWYAYRKL